MKLHLYIATLLLALMSPAILSANGEEDQHRRHHHHSDANITGHVQHARTLEHLPYVTLSFKGTTVGASTDATGHYFMKHLPLGDFTLVVSALGYKTIEVPVKVEKDKTIELNFTLEEQSVEVEQVVVSATRNETNKKESPTIVNVISPKLMENTGSNSLAEVLDYQSGLRVEYNCNNCGVPQLRINGLEGPYSQILLDSRPIFSSLAGVYGLEQLPASMIERVEVIRGGGSALFGSNAIGGVVNVITKEPLYNTVSVSNTTGVMSRKSVDNNTAFNGAFVSEDHKAGIYLFGMVRNRDSYDRNGDGFSEIPKLKSETIGFRSYYKTGAYSKITAEYHHISEFRRGGDMMDRPPHESNVAEQLRHKIDGGGLKFDLYTPNQKHRMSVYASAQAIDRESYFGTEQNLDAYGKTKDKTYVAGGQYAYSMDKLLFSPAELTVGLEWNRNDLHDEMLGYDRDMKQMSQVGGGYIQNEWKSEKLNLLLGARLDKHNLIDHATFSPRAQLRYTPAEWIGLRGSYSSGYRAPQSYDEDLHVAAVGGDVMLIELDDELKPEKSHSVSASADLYHNFGKFQTNLLIEGFHTTLNDVFTLVENGKDVQGNQMMLKTNAAGAVVKGVNLEARAGLPGVVDLQLGFTFQQSRYKDPWRWSTNNPDLTPHKKMFRSPDHYGYLTANVTVSHDFKVSLFGNYTGRMLVQHMEGYIDQDAETRTPDFFDMGFKMAYHFHLGSTGQLELSAGIKNIFDQFQKDLDRGPLKDAGYIYGPAFPRMYFFGVKFSL